MNNEEDILNREGEAAFNGPGQGPSHNLVTVDSNQQVAIHNDSHAIPSNAQVSNNNLVNAQSVLYGGAPQVPEFHSFGDSIPYQHAYANLPGGANIGTSQFYDGAATNYGLPGVSHPQFFDPVFNAGNANSHGNGYGTDFPFNHHPASTINNGTFNNPNMAGPNAGVHHSIPDPSMNPQPIQNISYEYPPNIPQQSLVSGNSSHAHNLQSIPEQMGVVRGQRTTLHRRVIMNDLQNDEHITKHNGNYYVLKCPACSQIFLSAQGFYNHIKLSQDWSHRTQRASHDGRGTLNHDGVVFAYGVLITDATDAAVLAHRERAA